jgi:cyclopropane fatty-acyl-phospholipid synthase-like methyltransferase
MTVLSSPSALRNREPIADVLATALPEAGLVLEIASGSGEHVEHFARRFGGLAWQPSEREDAARRAIDARCASLPNVRAALALDVLAPWPIDHAEAIVCINMIHASVPETVAALMAGAARILPPGGLLATYGAYKIDGAHTAPSNEAFDRWLREERDPRFGVRDLEAVVAEANARGLTLAERIAMPANNLCLLFRA